ncbi:chondroitinase family polysaccharide lyase [Mariniflexile ostreae]|uniref:Chondroitinase family polysaccharide lyase n=1 Tax=Mariniflexile ostreae TaxID=1520892 RepID=A0ABV5FBP0_9FLAO
MKSYINHLVFFFILVSLKAFASPENVNTIFSSNQNNPADDLLINQFKFETKASLEIWKSEKGAMEISPLHFKDGQNALLWNYSVKDYLVVADMEGLHQATEAYKGGIPENYEPAYYPEAKYGGIKMWIYQEVPQQGNMVFQVGSDVDTAKTNPKYKFEVNLDFKGWRAVWVCFEEDAKVPDYKGENIMKSFVSFPSKEVMEPGKLFIDRFSLLSFISKKRHSDLHFVNSKTDNRSDSYKILKPYQDYLNVDFNTASPSDKNDKEVTKYSKIISDKLEFLILGDQSDHWKQRNSGIEKRVASQIKSSKMFYETLNLKMDSNSITGVPLFATRDEHIAKEGMVFQAVSQSTMFPLAMDFRMNNNLDSQEKLITLLDYFEDQGWAAGSAMGTVDHIIRLNPMAQAVFLIRDDLEKQNKLKNRVDMLAWHSRIGSIIDLDFTRGENTDKVRGAALVKLIAVLLMENGAKKDLFLKRFSEYMNHVIDFAPGYSDTIKPDFSLYHHRGTYLNSYGIHALNTMALVYWLLEDTPYSLSEKSSKILKGALMRQSDIAFGNDIHYGVGGRFPDKNQAIGANLLPAFAVMSMKNGSVDDLEFAKRYNYHYQISDPKEMVSILTPALTYSGTFGMLDLMVNLHNSLKKDYNKPSNLNISMPYSSLLVHRKEDAYATVKGYNKYIWDFETGASKGENSMGRYLSFGTLIAAQNNPENGFVGAGIDVNDGFHWAYMPGATTKALPINKVFHDNASTEKYIEGYHRSFSETTFASGLTQGENGMYAMKLRDDVTPDSDKSLFDDSFRATKSYFFIGNEIICLGSDIENADARYKTITTLFQYKYDSAKPSLYNGKPIGKSQSLKKENTEGYFTDHNGLQYIIREKGKTVLEQGPQKSLMKVKKDYVSTNKAHVKAYLDHGKSPKNGAYEYQILLNTTTAEAEKLVASKSYKVWQKSKDLHSIYHSLTGIEAYAIFNINSKIDKGHLVKTDTPILAMFKKDKERAVLSIADPDLKLKKWNHNMSRMPDDITHGASEGSVVTITLKEEWYAAGFVESILSIKQDRGQTVVQVFCKDGMGVDIPLQKRIKL